MRKPTPGAEELACKLWRAALPNAALVALVESGHVWVDRVEFLRDVIGLSASEAIAFVDRFTPDSFSPDENHSKEISS